MHRPQGPDRPLMPAIVIVAVASVLSVCARVVPRLWQLSPESTTVATVIWNLMPVGALALFAGARLRGLWALFVPVAVMLVSDLVLIRPLAAAGYQAFDSGTPIIYVCFLAYVAIGWALRNAAWPVAALGGAIAGSVFFFLATNFAFWIIGNPPLYPKTPAGLMESYAAALPFYRNTFLADVGVALALFGVYAFVTTPAAAQARQPA